MEILRKIVIPCIVFMVLLQLCNGCGGGSGGGPQYSGLPSRTLSWNRPTTYMDGTTIPSSTMVSEYRIYIKTSNTAFTELDPYYSIYLGDWAPSPADPMYKFELNTAGIASFFSLEVGNTYFLKMRAVVSGVSSNFSDNTVSFNFDNNVSIGY
jgi:hypothetical protein